MVKKVNILPEKAHSTKDAFFYLGECISFLRGINQIRFWDD